MLNEALYYLQQKFNGRRPDTAIILGSGLGGLIEELEQPMKVDYADIPNFPRTTVAGHKGCFYLGKIGAKTVLCLQGRFHLYEGTAPQTIADVVRLLRQLGVKELIVTNAAGSLVINMPAGSLMLIKDHINMSGQNPLTGPHEEPYFPDMSNAYDKQCRQHIKKIADKEHLKLYEGVYLMVSGPNYETPSEVRLFRMFGADAVGMSTVPEVIAAVHQGMKVLGVSVISNLGTGLQEETQNHEDVLKQVELSAKKLGRLLFHYIAEQK